MNVVHYIVNNRAHLLAIIVPTVFEILSGAELGKAAHWGELHTVRGFEHEISTSAQKPRSVFQTSSKNTEFASAPPSCDCKP